MTMYDEIFLIRLLSTGRVNIIFDKNRRNKKKNYKLQAYVHKIYLINLGTGYFKINS